jgi:hypothetical protein
LWVIRGHAGVHRGELVDLLPLGGHIIVGDEATLLLLAGGVRVDGEVLVVQILWMLGGRRWALY